YGQIDLINLLISSYLNNRRVEELVANWHIVTALLIMSTYVLIQAGINRKNIINSQLGTHKS
ncbi:MAG: hypothetical protein AAFO07_31885, partial [Bacteroidota bacterium]